MHDGFAVGDLVKIKSYIRMQIEAHEEAPDELLYVNPTVPFVPEMKYLCGRKFRITELKEEDSYTRVYGFCIDDEDYGWTIVTEMIQHVDEEIELEFSNELDEFLREMSHGK